MGRDPVVEERGGRHGGRGAAPEAGSVFLSGEEAAAGSRGAGVERGAATGARARAVTPARAGSLNETGRAAPLVALLLHGGR